MKTVKWAEQRKEDRWWATCKLAKAAVEAMSVTTSQQQIIAELITTEKSYVKDLTDVTEVGTVYNFTYEDYKYFLLAWKWQSLPFYHVSLVFWSLS